MARQTPLLVLLAMIAFAANSLLCRMALKNTLIDAGTFTAIRIFLRVCGAAGSNGRPGVIAKILAQMAALEDELRTAN